MKTTPKKKAREFNEDNWPLPKTSEGEPWLRGEEIPPPAPPVQLVKKMAVSIALAPGIPHPDEFSPTWPFVFAFACAMEHKLSLNRRKGDAAGWRKDGLNPLQDKLDAEVEELDCALADMYLAGPRSKEPHKQRVLLEAADVANFAMMIADCVGYDKH